ncbi:MFS transporter [Betaproteobacteria bacterium]|nr:MFS transporter [Betaproteobacteria bacterium]
MTRLFYPFAIACVAAIGGFLFGFDTAVINGAVIALEHTFDAGAWGVGLSVSLSLLGAAAGAFFAGGLVERYGRIRCMIGASVLFFISAIGSGVPFGIYDFIIWRVIGGFGVGAASIIVPAYIAETAPAAWRGRMGSLQQLAIVIGIFVALLSNYAIAAMAGGSAENTLWFDFKAWQWMFWVECIPAALYGILALFIPESPRYLVAKQRKQEAEAVLKRLIPHETVLQKIADIERTILTERLPQFRDLLATISGKTLLLPIVWVGLGLAALQQLVGINVIFYYGNVLWQSVGFSEQDSLMLNVLTSVINILTTLIAIASIDKVGRKPLLLIGSIGMFFMLLIMSIFFATAAIDINGNPILEGSTAVGAVIAANLYIVFFGMSWGPIMWVMLGEMFNNRIRGAALAVAGLTQWFANFAVSVTFPSLTQSAGLGGAYGLYAFFAFLSIFFVFKAIKETKGVELEDM